ncbi:multiprotein-bridging factor 1 family protein [Streptomyces sp. NPDC058583]|uniref:helix-turn-helix domain-containing protein n=1 Tax=unclassified Streptomyces TaxID=2593676 RepID=UPI0036556AA3
MARAENPVDHTVPNRGLLADLLRGERARAGMTYAELATKSGVSAATLKRAASGTTTPSQDTVKRYLMACKSPLKLVAKADSLRLKARRDERGGGTRFLASTVSAPHALADALKAIHINYGAPTYREMQHRAGSHVLPLSSISRILQRQMLPVDERQMAAFLTGCGVPYKEQEAWLDAWARATGRAPTVLQHGGVASASGFALEQLAQVLGVNIDGRQAAIRRRLLALVDATPDVSTLVTSPWHERVRLRDELFAPSAAG